jgi:putative flippase GtrA
VSRAGRFVGVGVGGFVVQGLVLHVLTAAGLPYLLATAVAVEAAILHNFLWHERWTWADRTSGREAGLTASAKATASLAEAQRRRNACSHDWRARLARFNGWTALISIGGNVALMGLLVGRLHLPLLAANLLAVLTLSVLTFLSADRLVFATKLTNQHNDPTPM